MRRLLEQGSWIYLIWLNYFGREMMDMKIYNREFDELKNDFSRMWDFLIQDYADKNGYFIWTIGRLGDWKYGIWNEKKCFPNFMRKNAQLWFNNFEDLIGFVISENCDNSFTVFAKKGYEFLYSEILKWVKVLGKIEKVDCRRKHMSIKITTFKYLKKKDL
jgi:hypothetical protein